MNHAGLVEIHRSVSPWQNVIQIGDASRKASWFSSAGGAQSHDLGALTGAGTCPGMGSAVAYNLSRWRSAQCAAACKPGRRDSDTGESTQSWALSRRPRWKTSSLSLCRADLDDVLPGRDATMNFD